MHLKLTHLSWVFASKITPRIEPCPAGTPAREGRVIDMALSSVIRRWHLCEGMEICEIARRTGLSRNTIRKYLSSKVVAPKYPPRNSPSKLDAFGETLVSGLARESAGAASSGAISSSCTLIWWSWGMPARIPGGGLYPGLACPAAGGGPGSGARQGLRGQCALG